MRFFKQRGSALVVSLVMLTSVTFLAVLSLQSSTTEIRIVSNMQIKQEMFYTTERELIAQFNRYKQTPQNTQELKSTTPLSINDSVEDQFLTLDKRGIPIDTTKVASSQSKVRYINISNVTVKNGLVVGSSPVIFSQNSFEILSETIDLSNKFKSEQLIGFTFLAPAN